MLRNNKVNMVIAMVVAILLWMYVVGQVNPSTTKKISDIPITFVGEEQLNSSGLAVADIEQTSIAVTLEGKRADLVNIDSEDVLASADISDLGKGKNAVPVTVTVPKDTELTKVSAETVNVTVEDRVVESKDVQVVFEGTFEKESEPGQVKVAPEKVLVSGARTAIDKVDHVQVAVGSDRQKDGRIEADVSGSPVDAGGIKVEHVGLDQKDFHVSAVIMETKTVDLKVETVGELPDGFQVESIEVARQITIKGPKDVLSGIDGITADPLNIDGLTKTVTLAVTVSLREGVEIAEGSKKMTAVVSIRDLGVSTVTFPAGNIKIINGKSGWKAEIKDAAISAAIKGKSGSTKDFSFKDIDPYIDVKDLGIGSHKVKIKGNLSKETESVIFSPGEVEVTISEV